MIEAENLVKYYGDRAAVNNLSFEVGKGEIVGLLGPNGAGKTTTMRMLTGYLPVDGGRAVVAGFDVSDKPIEVRKRLGYLPELVPLYTEMPVAAYLDFMAKIRGVPSKGRKQRVQEVMELCRIADVRNKLIGKLSRGYKQRVGLAQAIIHNPQVIILDEPTVGLDPRQIIEIRKVIRDLAGNHSIVLSTHILPEVSALCDRVVIVNRGRVLVEDTLANLERRDAGAERLHLELRGPQDATYDFLQNWPGVVGLDKTEVTTETTMEQVSDTREVYRYELNVAPGLDIREQLASGIIGQGWGLLELRAVAPTLEEIFVKLINDDLKRLEEEEVETVDGIAILPGDEEMDELPSEQEVLALPSATGTKASRKAAPAFLNDKGAGDEQVETVEEVDEE